MAYERALEALRALDWAGLEQLAQDLVDIMFDLGYYLVYIMFDLGYYPVYYGNDE